MDETVDSLKIKIDVEVGDNAAEKVGKVSEALEGLKTSVKGLDGRAMKNFTEKIGSLADVMTRFDGAENAAKSIDDLQQTLLSFAVNSKLIEEKVPLISKALREVASATSSFSNGLLGIRGVSSAFFELSSSVVGLKDFELPKDFKNKFDSLADSMGNVSKQGTGFKNLVDGLFELRTALSVASGLKKGSYEDTVKGLKQFSDGLAGVDFSAGTGLKSLASGLKSLTEIGATDISNLEAPLRTARVALQDFVNGVGRKISEKNIESFKNLASALEMTSKASGNFGKLAEGFKTLNGIRLSKDKFSKVAAQLKALSDGIEGVNFKSGEGLKNLARGLNELSKAGSGNQKNLADNLKNARVALEQFAKDLGKDITAEEMSRFIELADALNKVTEGYKKLTAARNAYKNAPKPPKNDTPEGDTPEPPKGATGLEGVTGNIMGSLGDLPGLGKFFSQITSSTQSITAAFKAAEGASGGLAGALGPVAIGLAGVVAWVKGIQKYIEFVNNEFDKLSKTLIKVADTIKNFTSGAIDAVKGKLEGIGKSVSDFAKDLKSASKVVKDVGKTLSNVFDKFTGGFFKNFEKSFKNIFNMVKRMALRKAINAIFKDINDSFENLVAFSRKHGTDFADSMDMFATSAKYLNNSLVAMASPIINMVMPVFDALVDKVVELMNVFNQLFSRFSGADMWTKAIKNAKKYGEEADKSSKKQKKLNNAILSFDEIHKLNGDNGKGKDFEASDLEDWTFEINSLDDLFDYLNEKLKGFISNFKDFLDGINWEKIKSIAYDLGEGIMKLLNTIFGDEGLAIRLGRSLAEIVNTAFSFALGAIDEWDPKAWGQSFVAFFTGIFDNLDWTLIRMTFENFGTKLAEYFNTIFSAEEMFEKLGKTLSNGFNAVLSGISNFVKDIDLKQFGIDLGITFRETFGNIDYSMLFTTLTTLLNKVFQALAGWVSESDLPGVVDKIGKGLTEGLKNINWTDIRQGVLGFVEDIDESINTLFGNSELMSEIGKNIANGINTIKTAIASFWEDLDAEKVGGGIGTFIDSFLDTRNFEGKLMHLTELPQKILRIVAEAFKNIHTADLGKRIGEGLTNAIKNIDLEQIGTDLSTIGTRIGEFIGNLLENVDLGDIGKKLSGVAKKIVEALSKMMDEVDWDEVGNELAHGINQLVFNFTEDEENLANASNIIDGINSFLESLIENVEWEGILDEISSFIEELPLDKLWSSITQIAIKFWEAKRGIVKAWFREKISGIFDGIWEAINEKLNELNFGDMIWDAFMFVNPVTHFTHNPLAQEVLSYLGLDEESLKKALTEAFQAMDFTDLENLFSSVNFESFSRALSDTFRGVTNTIKELAGTIKNFLQPALDGVKGVFDGIKSVVDKIYNKLKDWVSKIEDLVEPLEDVASLFGTTSEKITGNINNSSAPRPGERKKVKNNAVGMHGGVILDGATVFGMQGDTRLVGGEAGKEAVVGVGSLSTMIQSSVLGAMSPMSMSTAVEAGVRSAMQGGGTSPVVDVTLKCDSETLFRMVKQGQTAYNGRYHFVEDFA